MSKLLYSLALLIFINGFSFCQEFRNENPKHVLNSKTIHIGMAVDEKHLKNVKWYADSFKYFWQLMERWKRFDIVGNKEDADLEMFVFCTLPEYEEEFSWKDKLTPTMNEIVGIKPRVPGRVSISVVRNRTGDTVWKDLVNLEGETTLIIELGKFKSYVENTIEDFEDSGK